MCTPSPFHHYFPLFSVVTLMMWPLAVYHRLWDRACVRLKPALQRLDFSVRGYMMSKQRERQRKCKGEASFCLGSLGERRKAHRSDIMGKVFESGKSGMCVVCRGWWVKVIFYSREIYAGLPIFSIWNLRHSHFKQI